MYLGYNTNGLPHHATLDALEVIATLGYRGVALTLDHHCLPPGAATLPSDLATVRRRLRELDLHVVIETGGRFVLDRFRKHYPTLMATDGADRERRIAFYRHALDVAEALDARIVSLWSGIRPDQGPRGPALDRLVEGLGIVLDDAGRRGIEIAFEPEPGMFIETMSQFEELDNKLHTPTLQLTLDIGHVCCVETQSIPDVVTAWAKRIRNIHIEDMRPGVHEHLFFGEGTIDFPPVFAALARFGYTGGVFVELSRHGHVGPEIAQRSMEFLRSLIPSVR